MYQYGFFNIRKDYRIFNDLGCKVIGEVGVLSGKNAAKMIEDIQPIRYHGIDPWVSQDKEVYNDGNNKKQSEQDRRYEESKKRIKNASRNILCKYELHRGFSEDVLSTFEDNYFDMIYIDGNHGYEYVLQDLELARDKVKECGYICGHDFVPDKNHGRFPSVYKAVKEFLQRNPTLHLIFSHWDNYIIADEQESHRVFELICTSIKELQYADWNLL